MRGQQCVHGSRRVLQRLFLAQPECLQATRQASPWQCVHQLRTAPQKRRFVTSTPFAASKKDDMDRLEASMKAEEKIDPRYTTRAYQEKTGRARYPQDYEITDPLIRVLDGGTIEGPLNTRFVMSKLMEGESLRMVEPYDPGNPKERIPPTYALCKIIDKNEAYRQARELKEKKKGQKKVKTKEIELSWGISENDLLTKTTQIGNFLEKGNKVELTLGKKRGGKEVAAKAAAAVLARVRQEIEAKNGMEIQKKTTGEVGGTMKLFLEPKPTKKQGGAKTAPENTGAPS
ncbi:Translation initiation factor IF-like protein [Emericellopsis cladophorae]|uniref:Translation initiation factor IF-like protein n=1 Tax=Emericellopsis cladophorae TaxID=2686198 RepID=A0A9P9Y7C5_9HYPO|nr:Translation initiation factor IF-like protein [Emericellopsis cladophorae]KAI6784963.1 Translation initiation factor IF-like protein [Emericellopsis cladophorae]